MADGQLTLEEVLNEGLVLHERIFINECLNKLRAGLPLTGSEKQNLAEAIDLIRLPGSQTLIKEHVWAAIEANVIDEGQKEIKRYIDPSSAEMQQIVEQAKIVNSGVIVRKGNQESEKATTDIFFQASMIKPFIVAVYVDLLLKVEVQYSNQEEVIDQLKAIPVQVMPEQAKTLVSEAFIRGEEAARTYGFYNQVMQSEGYTIKDKIDNLFKSGEPVTITAYDLVGITNRQSGNTSLSIIRNEIANLTNTNSDPITAAIALERMLQQKFALNQTQLTIADNALLYVQDGANTGSIKEFFNAFKLITSNPAYAIGIDGNYDLDFSFTTISNAVDRLQKLFPEKKIISISEKTGLYQPVIRWVERLATVEGGSNPGVIMYGTIAVIEFADGEKLEIAAYIHLNRPLVGDFDGSEATTNAIGMAILVANQDTLVNLVIEHIMRLKVQY